MRSGIHRYSRLSIVAFILVLGFSRSALAQLSPQDLTPDSYVKLVMDDSSEFYVNVLGHPLNALEWLVNHLSARGLGLKAGQFVTTGVTTEVYMAERGDRITADFGPVGSVSLDFA